MLRDNNNNVKEVPYRKKILFILSYLPMGGAERVAIYLMRFLNKKKYQVTLCLFQKTGYLLEEIPEDIEIIDLKKRSRFSFLLLCLRLRMTLKKISPDMVVPFLWYPTVITGIANIFSRKCKVISYEPHNHKQDITDILKIPKFALIDFIFKRTGIVITDSEGAKKDIIKSYKLKPDKFWVIHNPVDIEYIDKMKQELVDNTGFSRNIPVVITFGRLIFRKGFADLIKAFNEVLKEKEAYLVIIGEGEERNNLERLIVELELTGNVELMGFAENPYKYISKADVFVFPSLWEGFGNTIIEAMACSVPVIATRCPHGPEEIITDKINGILVPPYDVKALSEEILKLLNNEALKRKLAEEAVKRANDFAVEKVVREYETVFDSV